MDQSAPIVPESVIAGSNWAMETFGCRRVLTAGAGTSFSGLRFFDLGDTALATGEYNDLVRGVLPQNKGALITSIFIRNASDTSATGATNDNVCRWFYEVLQRARVDVFVNNTRLAQHRIHCLPAAGPVYGGSPSAAGKFQSVDNAGPLLAHFELEVPPQIPIRLEVSLQAAVSADAILGTGISGGLEAIIQGKTNTVWTARR